MEEVQIDVQSAKVGMQLSRAIYDEQDSLLLPKEAVLTAYMLSRLKEYKIEKIFIYKMDESNYLEAVKSSESFKAFSKEHQHSVEMVKNSFNSILVDNTRIDEMELMEDVNALLSASKNNMQVLDMLHCIRNYDDSTYIHCVNVSLICHVMGEWLSFSAEDIQTLTLCGLLHDIGKLRMPKEILSKPAKLTDKEYNIMKTHPYVGYRIASSEEMNPHIKYSILQHHEKCDGSGYPLGLKADKIDQFAKIVTIADIYDAMTANRVYRDGLCPFDVIKQFEEDGFQKYDPYYLLVFLQRIVETYINKYVMLSNNEKAQIIMINKHALAKPVVRTGKGYIDLSKEKSLFIRSLL